LYNREHDPAHFHAKYGDFEMTVGIETGVVEGRFPPRALRLTLEWHGLHVEELRADWLRAQRGEPLQPIAPFE
jgi:hypothetical protein